MGKIDPEEERRRLVEFYSRQMDGELEKVAAESQELSDIAIAALRAELIRRGLNVEPLAPRLPEPPQPVPALIKVPDGKLPAWLDAELPLRELTTLRKFRHLPEALLAQGCLESSGIESCLVDDK
jgi:hypothetical protein